MRDESTKQAAQEYLAAKLTEKSRLTRPSSMEKRRWRALPWFGKRVKEAIFAQCGRVERGDARRDAYLQGNSDWGSSDLVRSPVEADDGALRILRNF